MGRAAIWLPGLAVALGAAVATAHGLYEVAVASRVPDGIAWLYPLITDGLALVAYAATARLTGPAARYAWTVVVIAAGLSGLAQASYLAGGPTVEVASALRFGIGAWPAIAAAVVAHLLYLLANEPDVQAPGVQSWPVQPAQFNGAVVQPEPGPDAVQLPSSDDLAADRDRPGSASRPVASPQRDRAEAAATRWAQRHGAWPSVSELETTAEVSRGTAAAALKALREQRLPLHLITGPEPGADTDPNNEASP
ncbi:hypothetical protein LQ327_30390 [Actinomycetospora endophytica]|uniref:DUF2637 domain-containing protein n=1 Tax=Actinomycetospora endophytica TaxID=2291215 RepID=A0ABS8PHP7_9PSEU|nr:hypothetical protein [Actinomycetospora endophytica]MCD2197689.1 hypothetical protein [Actinomycetospora endophytica]